MFEKSIWHLRAACLLILLALFATEVLPSHAQVLSPLISTLPPSNLGGIPPPVVSTPPTPPRGHFINEFTLDPNPVDGLTSLPQGITRGPDGDIWFTEHHNDKIGRVVFRNTPLGPLTPMLREYNLPPGSQPSAITSGPNNELWFTAEGSPAESGRSEVRPYIGHITSGVTTGQRAGVLGNRVALLPNASPRGITMGPSGDIWFTDFALDRIERIFISSISSTNGIPDGMLDALNEIHLRPTPEGLHPLGITVGPDNQLWFTEFGTPVGPFSPPIGNRIEALTVLPVGNPPTITTRVQLPNDAFPTAITTGPGPNPELWFTESGRDAIGHVSTAGRLGTELPVGPAPVGITTGPDGNLWFTESQGNRIGNINP